MAHVHDKFDFTTSAYIVFDNKLLLLHHKKIGRWLQPGGHIELDEDPLDALWREIEEETGLKQSDLTIIETSGIVRPESALNTTRILPTPFDFNVHDYNEDHRHIDIAYPIKSMSGKIILEEAGAHGIGWFSKKGLEVMLKKGDIFQHTFNYGCLAINIVANNT